MTSDTVLIKAEAEARRITRLCHFTPSRKLAHILTDSAGIWCTTELRNSRPDLLDQTDPRRLDGHEDYICCSVEYPNTWYLRKVKAKPSLFPDWVVLFLNPSLVWQEDALYCHRNAATEYGRLIQDGYAGFRRLYGQEIIGAYGRVYKRTPQMPPCCPTDDQAEVLIREHIPQSFIEGVGVASIEQAKIEIGRLTLLRNVYHTRWYVAPALFDGSWSDLVRQGRRPAEVPYQETVP